MKLLGRRGVEKFALLGGAASFPAIPKAGLAAYWPMDDAHVSGATAQDVAGGFNGTISGVGVSSGVYKRNFDGTACIEIASCPVPNFHAAHGVMWWAAVDSVGSLGANGGSQTFLNFSDGATSYIRICNIESYNDTFPSAEMAIALILNNSNIGVALYAPEEDAFAGNGCPIKQGCDLMMFGYSYDGVGTITTFYNGKMTPNYATSAYGANPGNRIGARAADFTGSLDGSASGMAVYGRALTAADASQFFRAGPPSLPNRKRTARLTGVGASNMVSNSYFELALKNLKCGIGFDNIAVSGKGYDYFDTNFNALVAPYFDASFRRNILLLQTTNGMDIDGLTAAQDAANAVSIATKWKASGATARVVLFGAWNFGGNAAFIQKHADFNTAVRGNPVFDGFVDVWNIPGLNTGTTPPDTSLSPDNNHLTFPVGHALVEPYCTAVVNSVW